MRWKNEKEKGILGWREWVALPELGVWAIKAKLDTGARTSALHVEEMELYESEGLRRVRFRIHPRQGFASPEILGDAALIGRKRIKSSTGHESLRPVIRTLIQFRDRSFPIELSLANRDMMGFRMLIGRTAVRGKYLLDPARSYLGGIFPETVR